MSKKQKQMKHILFTLMVALAVGNSVQATTHMAQNEADTASVAAPKATTEAMKATVDKAKEQLAKDRAELAKTRKQLDKQRKELEEDLDEDEVALYSDTTSTDSSHTSGVSVFDDDDDEPYDSEFEIYNPIHYSNPISFFMALLSTGTGAFIAISILIILFLFIFLPFIVVILILRYLFRRSSNKQARQQQAYYAQPHVATEQSHMATEQSQGTTEQQPNVATEQPQGATAKPEEPFKQMPVSLDAHTEETIRSGIKTTALGLGLFFMFMIWQSEGLMGIGALVCFIGLGKLAIGYMAKRDQEKKNRETGGNR